MRATSHPREPSRREAEEGVLRGGASRRVGIGIPAGKLTAAMVGVLSQLPREATRSRDALTSRAKLMLLVRPVSAARSRSRTKATRSRARDRRQITMTMPAKVRPLRPEHDEVVSIARDEDEPVVHGPRLTG